MNKFYVYAYLDPNIKGEYHYGKLNFNFEPFYIGKGSGYRANIGLKDDGKSRLKYNRIKNIIKLGSIPIIIKLYEDLTEEEALKKEIETIRKIGRIINKKGTLINITKGGEGMSGYKHTKKWISILNKPVIQYSLNNEFIKEFKSIKDASNSTGILRQNIGSCANNKYKTAGGFIWKFKNCCIQGHLKAPAKMPKHSNKTKKKMCGKKRSHETIEKKRKINTKPINQYDVYGNFIKEWYSLSEACRFYKISMNSIIMCCKGKNKLCKGYIWRYKDNTEYGGYLDIPIDKLSNYKKISTQRTTESLEQFKIKVCKPVIQYNKNNEFISEYLSLSEASKISNVNKSGISMCCNNIRNSAGGFIWRYKNNL